MKDLRDKVAFITGGASGIGLSMGKAMADAGAKIVLADIEEKALKTAEAELKDNGATVLGVVADVTKRADLESAAQQTISTFGKINILCNNAGIGAGGPLDEVTDGDWQWVIDVNLMGVVHGLQVFLPLIKEHGEGGHIVNTASIAGLLAPAGLGPYVATKFAVVGLSESLVQDIAPHNIGVSVLCPMWVRTRIHESDRNRGLDYGKTRDRMGESEIPDLIKNGMDPDLVGAKVVAAIKANQFYILTHPETKEAVIARMENIVKAFGEQA